MTKKPKREDKIHIIVLGGGLAGLTAAYELAKAGKKVTVIERNSDIGGLARTITVGNFKFDTGPHRWYTKSDMVNNWMLNLLKEETIEVPRLTRIYFDKKFFYYPIRIGNAMKGMGLPKSIRSLVDYFIARLKFKLSRKQAITLEDGYISQFGKTLYETFFKRYSEKLWGKKCAEISADWIGQRSRGFNISTILKENFLKSRKTVSFVDEFSYPRKGIGRLAEKLASGIKESNGVVLLDSNIVRIDHKNSKIVNVTIEKTGKRKKITGDQFISSIAISDLISMLNPSVSKKIMNINNKLHYRDEILVALFINKHHITSDTWIYIHPFEIPFVRLMEMDNWSAELSPKNTTTLVFEIACNQGDNTWRKSDKELSELVTNAYINEFHSINRKDILGFFVHRVPKQYPIYHIAYREDVDYLKRYIKQFSDLQVIGRNGTFRYNNMDHSIETGLYAAWNIITGEKKFNIESVNIEREYLEEKKIEAYEDEQVEKI